MPVIVIKKFFLKYKQGEFLFFLLLGGIAAGVNFVSRLFYSEFMSYRMAVIIAYVTGMVVAFLLFKHYVFSRSGKKHYQEIRDFTLVNIIGIVLVWVISIGLSEYVFPSINFNFFREEVAHLIGIATPAISSYFGHKYITFRKK